MHHGNSAAIKAIIDRLGGQNATARLLGCRQSTVWRWVDVGQVPVWRIWKLIDAAAKLDPPVHLRVEDFAPRSETTREAA